MNPSMNLPPLEPERAPQPDERPEATSNPQPGFPITNSINAGPAAGSPADPDDTGPLRIDLSTEPAPEDEDTGKLVTAAGGAPPPPKAESPILAGIRRAEQRARRRDADEAWIEGVEAGTIPFEDLTLAEALGQMARSPFRTLGALIRVAWSDAEVNEAYAVQRATRGYPQAIPSPEAAMWQGQPLVFDQPVDEPVYRWREGVQLALRLMAFLFAWAGTNAMANAPVRSEEVGFIPFVPLLVIGGVLWFAAEFAPLWRVSRASGLSRSGLPPLQPASERFTGLLVTQRIILALAGVVFSAVAWALNSDNRFTLPGFLGWLASIVLWASALAPADWNYWRAFKSGWSRVRRFPVVGNWTLLALIAILLFGGYFRFNNLDAVPPEMTSDHVEKLLDANRVANGETNIFFANNGGREPAQMYFLALLSRIPGFNLDFHGLKVLSAVEGMVAILFVFWMGREFAGAENRRLGTLVGLALAALVAASYWHEILSRMGLRIVLTTIITPWLLIYLVRAMRFNRRADFVKAGLVLGFGLYTYQAVRMLPVVVVAGIALAFLFRARTWRARRDYVVNFVALVFMAFVVFVPMARYISENSEEFWRRTTGRLLGDSIVETTDEAGNIVRRNASLEERVEAFQSNLPVLMNNFRNALLMFNWKGDVAWINGSPNRPAMDPFAGGLFVVGLAAWLALFIRRRDVAYVLVPVGLLILLLPSALSIAYPIENPSHTRTSGALPLAYLIAALPLALIGRSIWRVVGSTGGAILGTFVVAGIVFSSYTENAQTFFVEYRDSYLVSALPHSEGGDVMRDFINNGGGYGNAFMIGYPYWWDDRALGIEAGRVGWRPGIVNTAAIPRGLGIAYQRDDEFRLDPDKDLLFLLSNDDDATKEQLPLWFPNGVLEEHQSYQPEDWYATFRVPTLGVNGLTAWLREHAAQ